MICVSLYLLRNKLLRNSYYVIIRECSENDDSTEGMIEEKVQEMTKKLLKMKVPKILCDSNCMSHTVWAINMAWITMKWHF